MGLIIQTNLSNEALHYALKAAWPDEGFHVHSFGDGRHEIDCDNGARTVEDLNGAANAWKGGASLSHARQVASAMAWQAHRNRMADFRPAAPLASAKDAADAWADHVRESVNRAYAMMDKIKAAKTAAELATISTDEA